MEAESHDAIHLEVGESGFSNVTDHKTGCHTGYFSTEPSGAFYIYADRYIRFSSDSFAFCRQLLEHSDVTITPGIDFG